MQMEKYNRIFPVSYNRQFVLCFAYVHGCDCTCIYGYMCIPLK